jgi:hypothetical protein
MQRRQSVARHQSSRQLLKTLTDNPALPQFVKSLHSPVLKRLIDYIGLRDAGDLIELTTAAQMREIFEVALWETLIPGQAEQLRPERFLEWLDVMLEVSPAFAAQRLIELGDTFLVLNVAPLITVVDRSVASEHEQDSCACVLCRLTERDEPFEIIDEYIVVGTHDDEWDSVRTALVELEGEDAEFLHRVLARCSTAPGVRGFAPDTQSLLDDETHERAERRGRSGFVTPEIAATFLKLAGRASLDDLAAQGGYDPIAQGYFDRLASLAAGSPVAEALVDDADDSVESAEAGPAAAVTRARLRALESALADAEIIAERQPALLSGPQAAREPALELQMWLDRLQWSSPDVFATRLGELVFLANVLMSGSWYQGARFTEPEAATAVLACANLGMDWLLARGRPGTQTDRAGQLEALLEDRPGLVRLFQIGWNLIQALPSRSAAALFTALRADHVRDQLKRKRWILDEIESALCDPDIFELIEQGEFADVGDNLVLLSLVLDTRACECLRTLISDFPRYPLQLNIGFQADSEAEPRHVRSSESRHLATLQQLARVEIFLDELDALLKI